jgi:hypothetical protein
MPIANNNKMILYGGIGLAVLVVIIIAFMMMKKEKYVGAAAFGTAPLQNGGLMLESDINGNLSTSATLPIGSIIIWSGTQASIPVGWALCDGTNGTPNLSNNNFPMGVSSDGGIGSTGGSNFSPLPKHQHSVWITDINPGNNVIGATNAIIQATSESPGTSSNIKYAGTAVNTTATGDGTTTNSLIPTVPPYVGVYFIMKMSLSTTSS